MATKIITFYINFGFNNQWWFEMEQTHFWSYKKKQIYVFFIAQLKRAKLPVINLYCTCVRPVLEYSCEAIHFALYLITLVLLWSEFRRGSRQSSFQVHNHINNVCRNAVSYLLVVNTAYIFAESCSTKSPMTIQAQTLPLLPARNITIRFLRTFISQRFS